jgi:hypothetical protein
LVGGGGEVAVFGADELGAATKLIVYAPMVRAKGSGVTVGGTREESIAEGVGGMGVVAPPATSGYGNMSVLVKVDGVVLPVGC